MVLNGTVSNVHGCRFQFYCDGSLKSKFIMSHVFHQIQAFQSHESIIKLTCLKDWKQKSDENDYQTKTRLLRLLIVFEDVPQIIHCLLHRKYIFVHCVSITRKVVMNHKYGSRPCVIPIWNAHVSKVVEFVSNTTNLSWQFQPRF